MPPDYIDTAQQESTEKLSEAQRLELWKAELLWEIETHKANQQIRVQRWQINSNRRMERWKERIAIQRIHQRAQIDFSLSALRGAFLSNGGGIIALLTFIAQVLKIDVSSAVVSSMKAADFYPALIAFSIGVALSIITSGLAYVAQALLNETRRAKVGGNLFRYLALASGFSAIGCFPIGAVLAASALR